ncbi:MAG: metallophosphoesterase [Caldimicrobium sp.]|nr:metallophosphoesterase [Caldimicrobium sp.]
MKPPFVFISIFFFLYFLLHLYLYHRLKKRNPYILVLLLLAFFSPLFMRLSDSYFPPLFAYIISFASLFWMGFMLYFILIDLLLRVFLKKALYSVILSLGLSIYSYTETLRPELIHVILYSPKIPKDLSLRILHFSDVHLGPVMGMDKVRLIEETVKRYKPDLIISTGDFVDGNMKNKAHLKEALLKLPAPLGKYAVLGNHEYYRGIDHSLKFTRDAGFTVLRDEVSEVLPFLVIVGLDDDDCRYFKACEQEGKKEEIFRAIHRDKFIILLKHKPRLDTKIIGSFDLMLSGHTHGGLYFPLGKWLLKRFFGFEYPGWHALNPHGYLFVSKGLGTGGPPMRFLTPPDLAIIELKGGQGAFHLYQQYL